MVATIINCLTVIMGALIGNVLRARISDSMRGVVYTGAGLVALVLGLKMAFASQRIVYLALALITGGLLGAWLDIEEGILRFGRFLKSRFAKGESEKDFAYGFLDASVLFCVGAMTLIGAFKAGAQGDYELILTKSVLDGFMALMLSAAMGLGVAFSALTILVYQGSLTLLGTVVQPFVSELVLSELTGSGGVLVVMIGINLLGLAKLKTANFLPSIVLILVLILFESFIPPGLLAF
jgi:uncharacterized membrane protein YqgA involved in biofilm formation